MLKQVYGEKFQEKGDHNFRYVHISDGGIFVSLCHCVNFTMAVKVGSFFVQFVKGRIKIIRMNECVPPRLTNNFS